MAERGDRLPVVLMATVPVLTLRVGVGFVRFQAGRKRGVRQFRKALVQGGLSKDQADRLAQVYHDAGSIRKILRSSLPGL
jgi:hypothetical protein